MKTEPIYIHLLYTHRMSVALDKIFHSLVESNFLVFSRYLYSLDHIECICMIIKHNNEGPVHNNHIKLIKEAYRIHGGQKLYRLVFIPLPF